MIPHCQIKTPEGKRFPPNLISSCVFLFSYEGSEKGHHAGIKPERGLSKVANINTQHQVTMMRQRKEDGVLGGLRGKNIGRAEMTETME